MRFISVLFLILGTIACSDPPPADMIEIKMGGDEYVRLNNAAQIVNELLQQGFPNTTCGSENDPTEGCNGEVSLWQLHVQPYTGHPSGRVYLRCVIHDESAYFELLDICLNRVREQVVRMRRNKA